jgi:hemerythrin superfamily protein
MMKQSLQRTRFLLRSITRQKRDGMDLLESDHVRVELLFLRWRLTNNPTRRGQLFDTIKKALTDHMRLEEARFYPECGTVTELLRLVSESYEEHRQIKALLKEISGLSQSSQAAQQKMRVLMEEVENHVYKEENYLFPRVREFMKKNQLQKLSRDLLQLKEQKSQRIAA